MSYITLSKNNLFYNLKQIESRCNGKDKIMAVLKDNAYGHGIVEMAIMLKEYGVTACAVRNLTEASLVKEYFDEILVFCDIPKKLTSYTIGINCIDDLNSIAKGSVVHIKFDTGMHRNGITLNEVDEALDIVKKRELKLTGIYTHFHCSDMVSCATFVQQKNWEEIKRVVSSKFSGELKFHSRNSHSLFRLNEFDEDYTRIGIAMYGYLSMDSEFKVPKLKPVLSLYAQKLHTREVKANSSVGYGECIVKRDMIVSTYDIGYADGFSRRYQNKPTEDGHTIVGNISMGFTALEGDSDTVLLFNDIKRVCDFEYEGLTSLGPNITRKVIE